MSCLELKLQEVLQQTSADCRLLKGWETACSYNQNEQLLSWLLQISADQVVGGEWKSTSHVADFPCFWVSILAARQNWSCWIHMFSGLFSIHWISLRPLTTLSQTRLLYPLNALNVDGALRRLSLQSLVASTIHTTWQLTLWHCRFLRIQHWHYLKDPKRKWLAADVVT